MLIPIGVGNSVGDIYIYGYFMFTCPVSIPFCPNTPVKQGIRFEPCTLEARGTLAAALYVPPIPLYTGLVPGCLTG